jgi:hypothetical protein
VILSKLQNQKTKKHKNQNNTKFVFFINILLVVKIIMSYQAYEFLVAPTPSTYQEGRGILFSERHLRELVDAQSASASASSTYQEGRGILFSERHLRELVDAQSASASACIAKLVDAQSACLAKLVDAQSACIAKLVDAQSACIAKLEQRRIRSQISKSLLAIQSGPAWDSHADHFEFLYREYSIAQTPERCASVKAQVDHYVRILATKPSPTSLSSGETVAIYQTPPRSTTIPAEPPAPPPRLKKAATLPLSSAPSPKLAAMNAVMRSKSGSLSPEDFERGMEYMIYRLEMAGAPAAKLAAYVELYDFFMDQPIIMMKSPEIRRTALSNLQATRTEMAPTNETLANLEQRFTTFLQSLRVHPYYVA